MAVDPALVGFDVVNTLQDTLLNYVMANRRMEQQNRQFNTQMQLQRDRFESDRDYRQRLEDRMLEKEKAGARTFGEFFKAEDRKRDIDDYKRDRTEYIAKQRKDPTRTDLLNLGGFTPYGLGLFGGKKAYESRVTDLLTKEFEENRGMIPQTYQPQIPDYNFVPDYAPELLSYYRSNNPDNILNQAALNQLMMRGE